MARNGGGKKESYAEENLIEPGRIRKGALYPKVSLPQCAVKNEISSGVVDLKTAGDTKNSPFARKKGRWKERRGGIQRRGRKGSGRNGAPMIQEQALDVREKNPILVRQKLGGVPETSGRLRTKRKEVKISHVEMRQACTETRNGVKKTATVSC